MDDARRWMHRLFDLSPMMIVICVVGSLIAAFALSVYGFFRVLYVVWTLLSDHDLSDHREERLSIQFIELIDVFLIAVILLIVALGLFQLFSGERANLPVWLRVRNLDQLKHKIIGVLCVILGVNFVSNTAEWDGGIDILYLGAAIALVLTALVFLLRSVDRAIGAEFDRTLRDQRTGPQPPASDSSEPGPS